MCCVSLRLCVSVCLCVEYLCTCACVRSGSRYAQEAKEIDDRASAAARERKLTATPASSTAALHSLKKQGDKEFAQVEAVWRSKFKITKEGEVLLACTRFFVCVGVCVC